ncbi:MAG: nucleoside-diphosphate sugar epimerase/dehydratase [Sphingobacteriaceae bacterium]|nr:nucleoside-diphosphate sugar epimerase/dehydratase [Sphingobacteriaceae bacterium]
MITRFLRLYANRFVSRWLVLLIDLAMVMFAFQIAVVLRYNFELAQVDLQMMFSQSFMALGFYTISFLLFRSFSGVVRHTSVEDAFKLVKAAGLATSVLVIINLVSYKYFPQGSHVLLVPIAVLLIHFVFSTFLLISSRFIFKAIYQTLFDKGRVKLNILIYGAGSSGMLVKNTFSQDKNMQYNVIGFIDDNPTKQAKVIQGARVYGPAVLSNDFIEKKEVDEVILAIHNISNARKREIIDLCLLHNIKVKSVPAIEKWINGELTSHQIKAVKIEDLLQRDEIQLDKDNVRNEVFEKVVMVTGAAGSIGSEIARQLLHYRPAQLILVDQGETAMYELEQELRKVHASLLSSVRLVIADIRNERRMRHIFKKFRPNYVFHAAAYKHVPLMEENAYEAAMVNIFGTQNIADLSMEFGVHKFVMVSTDKAVNPTNVMGATKRIAEIYTQSLNNAMSNTTRFVTTRFGNVLGSNGSVIPLFKKQIEAGGPITVTHPDITRYFMTIPEACQLVLEAGVMGNGGEIFIFDMGESVRILDVAKKMVKLSGLQLGKDIQISFTGLRPGEKLYEELLATTENTQPTHHEKIMIAKVRSYDYDQVSQQLVNMKQVLNLGDENRIVAKIKELVPEFVSNNSRFEELDKVRFNPNTEEGTKESHS